MKKLIYLCLFLSFSNISNAQVQDTAPWCPDGATWVYQRYTPWAAVYNVYEYQGDTEIDGYTAKKIRDREVEIVYLGPDYTEFFRRQRDTNYLFLRESNDSIFIFHENTFKFIYNLSAEVGHQFIVNNFVAHQICDTNPDALVDDTLTLTQKDDYVVGDVILKRSYFSSLGRWSIGHLYGRVGPSMSLFPSPVSEECITQYAFSNIHCYSDNIRGSINFYSPNISSSQTCDYLVSTTLGIEVADKSKSKFIVYPNPGLDIITIDMDVSIGDLEIIDLNGRLALSYNNINLKNIDISKLSKGSYIIKVKTNSIIQTIKFIKE